VPALHKIDVPLDAGELPLRLLYGFPEFVAWLANDLPKIQPGRMRSSDSPKEQLDYRFYQWVSGQEIQFDRMFKDLSLAADEVWEMKTVDLRIFGWIYRPCVFIAVFGDYADLYKPPNIRKSYGRAVTKVKEARRHLALDEPKFTGVTTMTSFVFDIGERSRKVSRALGKLRSGLQTAFITERKSRKLTQQAIASLLGVNRSVVNRQLTGQENLTVRSAVELAWAMGWETNIVVHKPTVEPATNERPTEPQLYDYRSDSTTGTGTNVQPVLPIPSRGQLLIPLPNTREVSIKAE